MLIAFQNPKKELGMALQEMQRESWYLELPKELQQYATDEIKHGFTPPNPINNTLINIWLSHAKMFNEWEKICEEHFPYADPLIGPAQVKLNKVSYFTKVYKHDKKD